MPLILLTPCLLFIELPTAPLFYIAAIATSFIVTYSDTKNFEASVTFGAGVVTRMKPFAIWFIFLIWIGISAESRADIFARPAQSFAIIGALLIGALSAFYMRRCAVSRAAAKFYVPIILCAACVDILNKTAMDASPFIGGIVTYSWIQAVIISALSLSLSHKGSTLCISGLFTAQAVRTGIIIGGLFIIANFAKSAAMSLTPNPSYVSALIFTNPLWVSLYYKFARHKEASNIWAGYGLVASAALLVLITNH